MKRDKVIQSAIVILSFLCFAYGIAEAQSPLLLRELPNSQYESPRGTGRGYYKYRSEDCDPVGNSTMYWGRFDIIANITFMGTFWEFDRFTSFECGNYCPLINMGDIALVFGGDNTCHSGHKDGLRFDVRPMNNKLFQNEVNIDFNVSANRRGKDKRPYTRYSRSKTQAFINHIRNFFGPWEEPPSPPQEGQWCLWFSDPLVSGTTPMPSGVPAHWDHIHVGKWFVNEQGNLRC